MNVSGSSPLSNTTTFTSNPCRTSSSSLTVARVIPGETMVGGGSLPGGSLPTRVVAIGGGKSAVRAIGERLRHGEMPVVGRISEDKLLLDPRTVLPEEDSIVLQALREVAQ